ncbi:MAG: glycosyltransferase [Acidobacteriota bacterium]
MAELGLESRRYFLYVSRFEPENNPHTVAQAYRKVEGDLPLVMVGTAPYARRFIRSFTADADPRILFPGAIYGRGYRELLSNAFAYIHATEVGGTHPALVEAMGYGNCVVVNQTPENVEAAGGTGIPFRAEDPGSLTRALNRLLAEPDLVTELGSKSLKHALKTYDWDLVADRYLRLFRDLVASDP